MRRWKKRYDWNKKQHQTVEEFLEDGGDLDKLPPKGSPEPRCFTTVHWGRAPIKKEKGKSNYKRYTLIFKNRFKEISCYFQLKSEVSIILEMDLAQRLSASI